MKSNCTLESINDLRFGHGYRGNNRTIKVRVKMVKAQIIMMSLPTVLKSLVRIYVTKDKFVFLSAVEPVDSKFWPYWQEAVEKVTKYQEPKQLALFK